MKFTTPTPPAPRRRRTGPRVAASMLADGQPLVWLTGGGLVVCLAMILGLLALIFWQGIVTFWPTPVLSFATHDGRRLWGEITRDEGFAPTPELLASLPPAAAAAARDEMARADGWLRRRLVRTGNYDVSGEHFTWVSDLDVAPGGVTRPPWALVLERLTWGRFYGEPVAFLVDGEVKATDPPAIWRLFEGEHPGARDRYRAQRRLETREVARINHELERARLAVRTAELEHGTDSPQRREAGARAAQVEERSRAQFVEVETQLTALRAANARLVMRLRTGDGREKDLALGDIVRAYPANQLTFFAKLHLYGSRWAEFVSDEPREANSEGGVFPAIFGTVVMTLVMTVLVVPFGVLAALYLREYARAGVVVSLVRISINNLAGVPSIVFGVFGLGFFSYIVGGAMDRAFFAAKLPNPTFGTGGLLWASLTLALLTLPVVIVATEEALAAVPGSMREGSYACGASKWQTIWRIVLPRALPGIMTGAILAMARGAGEVAPLMLVGAVKLAPELPFDGIAPFLHPERSFMHLGFHIYDLGFQSQNSEAAKPMVFTTTLLLIAIITLLNLAAISLRTRLRRKFVASQF
jgi:phosphate transport system permease protein